MFQRLHRLRVMEKAQNLVVVPFAGEWSDLGGWDAVWREARAGSEWRRARRQCNRGRLHRHSAAVGIGRPPTGGHRTANVIAVAMPDAVLVADMSRAQDVRLAVEALKRKGARQATTLPRDHRPWGWFESLANGDRFQVKRIVVNPGGVLSLQSHLHRRALDRRFRNRPCHGRRNGDIGDRKPVDLCSARVPASDGESRKSADGPDRGPDRHLSGRRRYHALRGHLFARLSRRRRGSS
jgi:hypothetical protein